MERVTLPEPIYRGDPWTSVSIRLHRDISAATFTCQLRYARGSTPIEVLVDPTHQSDPVDEDNPDDDPYFVLTLTSEETAAIEANLLNGDVQEDGGATIVKFRVPVEGEYEQPVAP